VAAHSGAHRSPLARRTIDAFGAGATDLVLAALAELSPVLAALCSSVTTALAPPMGR
jgi:hypothetical protein